MTTAPSTQHTLWVGLGVALIGFSLLVILGWYLEVEWLVRLYPGLPSMQYNTALSFAVFGVALLALGLKQNAIPRYCLILVLFFNLLNLFQYLFSISLGIDEVFVKDIYAESTSFPGRTSPNTSISFIGCCLAFLHYQIFGKKATYGSILRGVFLVPLTIFLLFTFFSYFVPVNGVYRWVGTTGMAFHTALAFLIILVASLKIVFIRDSRLNVSFAKEAENNVYSIFMVILVLASLLLLNYWIESVRQELYVKSDVAREATEQAEKLKYKLAKIHYDIQGSRLSGSDLLASDVRDRTDTIVDVYNELKSRLYLIDNGMEGDLIILDLEIGRVQRYLNSIVQGGMLESHEIDPKIEFLEVERILEKIAFQENSYQIKISADLKRLGVRVSVINFLSFFFLSLSALFISKQFSYYKIYRRIEENEEFLDRIINSSQSGLYIYSYKKKINIMVNKAYTDITGYTKNDLDSVKDFSSLLHPDDVERVLHHMEQVRVGNSRDEFKLEYRFKHKTGRWVWCLSKYTDFTTSADGEVKEMLGSFIDVTDLKEKEKLLIKSKSSLENLGSILEHTLNEMYIFRESDYRFVRVNRSALNNIGYSMSEMQLMTPIDIKPGYTREKFEELVYPLANGKLDKIHFETKHCRKDGSEYHCYIELKMGVFDGEKVFIAMILDVSNLYDSMGQLKESNRQLDEANEKLKQSNAELEEFAYVASHDLQEPLRKILSYSEFLQKDIETSDKKKIDKDINSIVDASRRMQRLIHDILELSRLENRNIKLELCDLNKITQEVLDGYSEEFKSNGVRVLKPDLSKIQADRLCVFHIYHNIVGNSLKFRKFDVAPLIEFTYVVEGGEQVFGVKDNGIGIDSAYNERIFQSFQRLHGRSEYDGTGIGLSICKKMISRLGGRIWVESGLGKGAHFRFTLNNNEKMLNDG